MQKLTAKELLGFANEFEMACAAQDGDGRAWAGLWGRYRNMMMSMLRHAKGFAREELESEALDVFAEQLQRFDRFKASSPQAYSMHSWLWFKVINRTNCLIRKRKRDVHLYFESVSASRDGGVAPNFGFTENTYWEDDGDPAPLQNRMVGANEEIYSAYSPEKIAVESLKETDTDRVKAFYARLSPLQRDILAARREGMTLAQVAKKFRCSLTTVKNHVRRAKAHAEDIFQIRYA